VAEICCRRDPPMYCGATECPSEPPTPASEEDHEDSPYYQRMLKRSRDQMAACWGSDGNVSGSLTCWRNRLVC